MVGKIRSKTALLYGGAILLGILLGPFVSNLAEGLWKSSRQPAVAQAEAAAPAPIMAPGSPDATYICTPSYIGNFTNRVHVLCTVPTAGGIYYFAAPTSNSKNAARVLTIMLTAKSLGKNLQIYYDTNGSGSAYGSAVNDCRPINAIEMTN